MNTLSELECLGLMSYLHLSVNKYKVLREFLKKKQINALASYSSILDYKKSNIPSSLSLTENSAVMPIYDVLTDSLKAILDFSSLDNFEEITIFVKYGGDGMTD